jgi:hypothetical protein
VFRCHKRMWTLFWIAWETSLFTRVTSFTTSFCILKLFPFAFQTVKNLFWKWKRNRIQISWLEMLRWIISLIPQPLIINYTIKFHKRIMKIIDSRKNKEKKQQWKGRKIHNNYSTIRGIRINKVTFFLYHSKRDNWFYLQFCSDFKLVSFGYIDI